MPKKGAKRDPRLTQGKKVLEEWGIRPLRGTRQQRRYCQPE